MAEEINRDTRYEPERMRRAVPLLLLASLGGLLLLVLGSLALLYPATLRHDAQEQRFPLPPEPRLVTDETAELRQLRAAEAQRLASYGWVDQSKGLVHLPIEEAMRRIAEQGIPTWPVH